MEPTMREDVLTNVGAVAIAAAIQGLADAIDRQTEENVRQFEIREPSLAAAREASTASKLKYAAKKNSKTESQPDPTPAARPRSTQSYVDEAAKIDRSRLESLLKMPEPERLIEAQRIIALARVQNEAGQPLE